MADANELKSSERKEIKVPNDWMNAPDFSQEEAGSLLEHIGITLNGWFTAEDVCRVFSANENLTPETIMKFCYDFKGFFSLAFKEGKIWKIKRSFTID